MSVSSGLTAVLKTEDHLADVDFVALIDHDVLHPPAN